MIFAKRFTGVALAATVLVGTGCDSFLDVTNPGTLEAEAIDPERDGELISRSAMQNLIDAFGSLVINSGWFTNEARVGDTFRFVSILPENREGPADDRVSIFGFVVRDEKTESVVDWGKVNVNRNADGGALKINGQPVEYGIGTHANSIVEFDLPPGYTYFKARAGLDNARLVYGGGNVGLMGVVADAAN